MSYISLLNETTVEVDNLSSDILSIATSFSSLGSTTINNTILTGSLSGLATAVSNGGDLTYSYNPTTKTFTIQINNASISNTKLINGTAQNQVLLTGISPFSPTYQTLDTSFITENTNLYYTDSRSRLAVSGTAPIIYNSSTGVISLNTTISQATTFTATSYFTNGNNIQGSVYSAIYGQASTTRSGQIALIDGTSNNQYAQLYCRSNNFGVQGNITSISLEKPTKIVTSVQITNVGLTANYCLIDATGINIPTGETYKINGITVDTDDIQESLTPTNLYYTSVRAQTDAQLAISVFSVGCEIGAYYLGGEITLPPITTGSVSLSKLVSSTINKIIICNSLGVPTYSSLLSLTNIPTGTTGQILISNGTNNVWTTLSGDLTNNSGGGVTIGSGTVTPSKISVGTANQFLQTNSSLVNTWTTMSGDATLTNGVITIATNAITMSKILSSVFSMLAINGTLVQRDTSGGGTFTTVNSTDTTATNGTSDITIALNPTPSLTLGNFGSHTGVIILGGFASTASYSVIQKHTDHNLYIDNSGANSVNIGTRSTGQSVNLGSLGGSVKFNGGRFNNFTKFILNPCAFVGSILTTWVPVYHTASGVCLSNSITVRGANPIKITVNMSLNNWGTVSSNHHLSLARSTVAFTSTTSVSYDVITPSGTGSVYGIQHQLAGTQYGSTNFTYLDTVSVNTANTTYWYCVIVRSNSAASGSTANIGNNAYTEITLEEIF